MSRQREQKFPPNFVTTFVLHLGPVLVPDRLRQNAELRSCYPRGIHSIRPLLIGHLTSLINVLRNTAYLYNKANTISERFFFCQSLQLAETNKRGPNNLSSFIYSDVEILFSTLSLQIKTILVVLYSFWKLVCDRLIYQILPSP